MNALQIFKNPEFGQIRTVEVEGEPWLIGKDVAEALGYANPKNAVPNHVDEEDKLSTQIEYAGQKRTVTIINESGLYSLVMGSKLPTAKRFKRWVTSEVLPTIRKTGGYLAGHESMSDAEIMAQALVVAQRTIQERDNRLQQLEAENEHQRQVILDFEPKRQYLDTILSSTGTMATTQIAADYNLSAYKLNQILHDERIQRKVGDQWILYQEYMGKGYTKSETIPIVHRDGSPGTKMFTRWTQKGRVMIHEVLSKRGIRPAMDQ